MSRDKVVKAWVIQGPCPSFHEAHKEWLKFNWPTLYYALENLTEEFFNEKVED